MIVLKTIYTFIACLLRLTGTFLGKCTMASCFTIYWWYEDILFVYKISYILNKISHILNKISYIYQISNILI